MKGPARLALAVLVLTGCAEARERPLPTTPLQAARLNVELLSPEHDRAVTAGRPISVRVRAHEPNALLAAVGYYAARISPGRPVLDSAFVQLIDATDTIVTFEFVVPDSLPGNAQIELLGVAVGRSSERAVSQPRGVVVLGCSPGAVYC